MSISVFQRTTFALGLSFLLSVAFLAPAQNTQSVNLAWDASPSSDVVGYLVEYGTSSGNYTNVQDVGNTTTATVSNLAAGTTYYFVAIDYNNTGIDSGPSNEVTFTTTLNPNPQIGTNVMAPVDFNGAANEDLLWRNVQTGDTWIWLMNGTSVEAAGRIAIVDPSWKIVGIGNFDGQGRRDIVWYDASLGLVAIWTMNGFTETGSYQFQAPAGAPGEWAIVGLADFDRTGYSDLLWQDAYTGALVMWKCISSLQFSSIEIGSADPSWKVVGTADVEGTGLPDIIWHNAVTGGVFIWQLRNDQVSNEVSMGQYSLNWQIAGFGDFNGAGMQDILWRNVSTGEVCVWLMNGFSVASQWFPGAPSLAWNIVGTPDLSGDGVSDILWLDPSAGLVTAWLGTPTYLAQPPPFASVGAGWTVVPGSP